MTRKYTYHKCLLCNGLMVINPWRDIMYSMVTHQKCKRINRLSKRMNPKKSLNPVLTLAKHNGVILQ